MLCGSPECVEHFLEHFVEDYFIEHLIAHLIGTGPGYMTLSMLDRALD